MKREQSTSKKSTGRLGVVLALTAVVSATSEGRADDTQVRTAVIAQLVYAMGKADQACKDKANQTKGTSVAALCDQVPVPSTLSYSEELRQARGPYFRIVDPSADPQTKSKGFVVDAASLTLSPGKTCTTPTPENNFVDCPGVSNANVTAYVPRAKQVTWPEPDKSLTNYSGKDQETDILGGGVDVGPRRLRIEMPQIMHQQVGRLSCSTGSHVRLIPQTDALDHALIANRYPSFDDSKGNSYYLCSDQEQDKIKRAKDAKPLNPQEVWEQYRCVQDEKLVPAGLTRRDLVDVTYNKVPHPEEKTQVPFYAICAPNPTKSNK